MLNKEIAAKMPPLELARAFVEEAWVRAPQEPKKALVSLYTELRIADRPDKDDVSRAINQEFDRMEREKRHERLEGFLRRTGRSGVIVSTDDEGSQDVRGSQYTKNSLKNGVVEIFIGNKKVGELQPHPEDREIFIFKPTAGVRVFIEDHLNEEMRRDTERKSRTQPEAMSIRNLPKDFLRRPPPK